MHALEYPSATLLPFGAIKRSTQLVAAFFKTTTLLMLAFLFSLAAQGQTNYVYVNNQTAANSVVAYSVSPAGVLTNVPGSPFSTAGAGSSVVCYGLDRMVVTQNLLYVANTGDMTITGFTINPANGALTRIGSPVPSGLTQDACQGMSIAATPDGHFLMASSNGLIQTFAIGANGALTHSASTANCCTPNAGMKISVDGHFLAVANENNVSTFTVNPDGSLTSVLGSPFPKTGSGLVTGLDFSACSSNRLYGGEATGTPTLADAWAVDATGALSPIAGSPFQSNGNDSNVVLLSPNNAFLFESNQFTTSVSSFNMNADGSLGLIGRFGGVGTVHSPVGMATDKSGTFLYVADDNAGLALYRINTNGSLTSIKDQLINLPAEIQGVAAYPSRSCSTADLAISMTASSTTVSANNNVTYTITVTNNGPDSAVFSVADNLPSALGFISCTATGGGVCVGTLGNRLVSFPSLASGASATITLVGRAGSTIANGTTITNTATINNSSAIDPNNANNSASINVTVSQPAPTTLTTAPATGPFGGSAVLSAILKKTSDSSPAVGETINFFINRNAVGTALTNASGVATLTAPLGTITPGTYAGAIIATFSGDNNFAASSGTSTLTVTKPNLTVTANNLSRDYGDPNPALTYTITGFVNGDTQSVVTGSASCTTTATAASPIGTYPITCTQGTLAATNYNFVFVPGTLTVNGAPLTVTAANASRAYGAPNPVFTGTITGIKNGDNITATYASAATATSPVGTYPIVPTLTDNGTGALANYTVTSNNGTLTVTTASLVVSANNASRLYGDPNPVFSGTIAGLVNGDNITASFTTTAAPASPVGNYPITPVLSDPTNKLGNYLVTLNNGNLVVSPAPLTVVAADATRPYGTANPVFTGSIVGIKNGDNITATYSSPATITSPAGTYPIIPALVDPTSKLGNYTVTSVNGTLTISAAVLTVTASNASRLYGDPNPAFTGLITGILNGDNITATYATVATPASPVGSYAIVPTLSDNGTGALASYTVVINNGILTVNPAPLTVTVDSFSRIYGDPNPVFTGTIVGIKNSDNITATFGTAADATSAVGTYPIVATLIDPTLKLSNYTVTSSNGTLTITAAALSVTAADASRLFGTPNPPFSGIITGIKNNDPITAAYSTSAVPTSPVGTYPITPTLVDPAGKLGNYAVTSTNGALTINAGPTANFLFVNNQAAAGNSISGYSVAADGSLTELATSPTATGGLGANAACSSVERLVLSAGNNLLFVSNGGDQTISAFQINPATGALSAAAGSPFVTGLTLDACSGIALAASPDGRFLMASSNGQIKTFSIGVGGTITALSTAANSVTPNASMKISANGQFLAVSNGVSVSVYTINGDGSLAAVAGSPFAETGNGSLAGLDFSSISGLLYGAEASPTSALADAWIVGNGGILSAITGSPFSTAAINSNVVLLSPNDSLLFASNTGSNSVSSFSVVAGGGLSTIGSVGSAGSLHAPVGMATDRSGSLLFVADDVFGVAVFRIDGTGSLAQLSDVAIAGAGQVQSLVAYPPRMASNADLSVAISTSSPNVVAGQNVTYTITVTNNGADPAAATVTDALPSGSSLVSCSATGNGACIGSSAAANFYLLQSGESQTVTLVASTSLSIPDGTVTNNTASISNSSAVDANAGNNSASATVTVAQPATTTLAVAAASGTYGGSTTLSATLTTPGGPLAGETVSFTLNGSPAGSAVTDATGLASVSVSLVGIPAGSYPGAVAASFGGDANNAAASGSATLTVNPALLTVTAANASRLYGDPNPAFTGTITGIQNGENITATYASAATASSPVGTYSIVPTVSDNGTGVLVNYTVVTNNGALTVNTALLTVTAANASMVYGDPLAGLAGTITGIKNGENITASYSTTATSASSVGSYPIVPAVSDNGTNVLANYTVVLNNGSLTVTPAPLTVTAANASMVFGDAVPALSGTITGIKNADNITASYGTTATSASPIGSYSIVPALSDNGTGKLTNYTVTSVNGTLTITPAPLTVTAANASRLFGDPNPAFSGTITGIKNGDNITATYASAADATSPVGTYAIVPTLVDPANRLANYVVTENNGVLTVNAAPLTVTAANASRFYGDPNSAFTGTITGLKNGDNITAIYSSIADPTSPVGFYAIIPTLVDPNGKLSNYAVTITNGSLSVDPAPLVVTTIDAGRFYGDPNPAFTGSIAGLKNGDNITATFASVADPTSPVGTYAIVPTLVDPNSKLSNYTVTLNNGTLTVTPAPLSVVAADASRAVNTDNPVFTGTISGIKNGDNITATFDSPATIDSPEGTYAIVPTLVDPDGKLGNYAVSVVNGTLTITP